VLIRDLIESAYFCDRIAWYAPALPVVAKCLEDWAWSAMVLAATFSYRSTSLCIRPSDRTSAKDRGISMPSWLNAAGLES
jgi:hypothetical protein